PVPSPVGPGWTAPHSEHGAFAQTRPPGVNPSLLLRWRGSRLDLLNFHAHRRIIVIGLYDNPPTDGVATCRLNSPDLPGGRGIAVPSPESFSLEDPHRVGSHDPIFRSGHVGHPAGLDSLGHGFGPDRREETDLRSRLHHEGYRWQGCPAREVPGQGVADRQYRQPVRLHSPVQGATGDLSEVQGSRIRDPRLPGQRVRRPGAWNG